MIDIQKYLTTAQTYGDKTAVIFSDPSATYANQQAATYYDAAFVYFQLYDLTKNKSFLKYADDALAIYRKYITSTNVNYKTPGYWLFTEGLLEDYKRNGSVQSKNDLISLSLNAAYAPDYTPIKNTATVHSSREVAYNLLAELFAEFELGGSHRNKSDLFYGQMLDHLTYWINNPSEVQSILGGNLPTLQDESTLFLRPFMVALSSYTLIKYVGYYPKEKDKVVKLLSLVWQKIWDTCWVPTSSAFKYGIVDTKSVSNGGTYPDNAMDANTGGTQPTPDLNLLIVFVYAFLHENTKDIKWIDQGDQVFAGGLSKTGLVNIDRNKQFNQAMKWSGIYYNYRIKIEPVINPPAPSPIPVPVPVPESTPTNDQIVTVLNHLLKKFTNTNG